MKSIIRLFPVLVLALVVLATPVFAADPNPGPNSSSVACYFGTLGSHRWEWARQSNNDWFSMTGHWSTTELTKAHKFFTNAPQSEIVAACENARRYNKIQQPLFAAFAATSGVGSNYAIVSQGVQLFPPY